MPALTTITALLLTASAACQPPDLDTLLDGLAHAETRIKTLSVVTDYVKTQPVDGRAPDAPPARMSFHAKCLADRDGRLAYEVSGQQMIADGSTHDGRWKGAYDGATFRQMTAGRDGTFLFGSIDRHWSMHGLHPLEFTTRFQQRSIAEILKEKGSRELDEVRGADGRRLVVVETTPVENDGLWKYRFEIDPERSVVVRRASLHRPTGGDWFELSRITGSDYAEAAPGVWLPGRFVYESVSRDRDTGAERLSWRFEGTNTRWRVNEPLPPGAFDLAFPPDVTVTDHRRDAP